jgi:hypothetical protein
MTDGRNQNPQEGQPGPSEQQDPYRPPGPAGPYGQQNPYPPPPGYGPPGYGPPGYGPPGYGPPGYGPPGYGYGAPPPRRRNGRKILFIVLGVVFLLVAGCVGGVYALYRSQLKVNADKVNEFLGDMKNQNYPAAYDQLCANGRAQGSVTEYSDAAKAARDANRGVQSYSIKAVRTNNSNGVVIRTAGGTVTLTNGSVLNKTFSLNKENGKLCVDTGYAELLNGT